MIGHIPAIERMPGRPAGGSLPLNAASIGRLGARRPRHARGRMPVAEAGRRRGLIIDLDDTLYPRARFVRSGLAAVARYASARHGIPAADAYAVMTRACDRGPAGAEMQALCARFALPPELVPELVEVFRMHTPALFLPAEADAALHRLRADGWALAILTNGLPSVQFRKVAALGLAGLVDEVIYAEEHACGGKPSPAPFRAALRALDLHAAACVCVGDDPARDVRGARALGIATIRLARPGISVAAAEEADLVIDSLRMLPDAAPLLLETVTADVA